MATGAQGNTQSSFAFVNQSNPDQATCQRIPEEYVRLVRKMYQEKAEQKHWRQLPLLEAIFGNHATSWS
jgi:hypothetical protein